MNNLSLLFISSRAELRGLCGGGGALMRPSLSPPVQVPEPHVWHAPQRDDPTAEPSREGRARGGDPDRRLQGLQSRNRAGGILAAWRRDGASDTFTHTHTHMANGPHLAVGVVTNQPEISFPSVTSQRADF